MKHLTLLLFAVLGFSLAPLNLSAAEPPQPKPGQWEFRMQQVAEGKEAGKPATLQRCIVASEYAASKAKADDFAGRAALAKWLTEAGRVDEGAALAQGVIEADPENAVAHAALGHVRHRGSWMTPDEARTADGLVRHGETWYTPEEWALVGQEAKAKTDEVDRAASAKRWNVRVNEAVRLMLAPDKRLRAEGEKRLLSVATESKSKPLETLAAQVKEYAASTDRMVALASEASAGGGGGGGGIGDHGLVMAECRIQLAKLKRPIQNFTTGLAGSAAGSSVTLQLPELEVIRIGTTVGIPVR